MSLNYEPAETKKFPSQRNEEVPEAEFRGARPRERKGGSEREGEQEEYRRGERQTAGYDSIGWLVVADLFPPRRAECGARGGALQGAVFRAAGALSGLAPTP